MGSYPKPNGVVGNSTPDREIFSLLDGKTSLMCYEKKKIGTSENITIIYMACFHLFAKHVRIPMPSWWGVGDGDMRLQSRNLLHQALTQIYY